MTIVGYLLVVTGMFVIVTVVLTGWWVYRSISGGGTGFLCHL